MDLAATPAPASGHISNSEQYVPTTGAGFQFRGTTSKLIDNGLHAANFAVVQHHFDALRV
jgi:hypothetical protein